MQASIGQKVPSIDFQVREAGAWKTLRSDQIFGGKRVVVFALPGAFTPTCSNAHLPRYEELAPIFFQNGIAAIYCLAVNDAYVMEAWAQEQGLQHVHMLPDGNGDFTQEMGMLVDKREVGFGQRSWRYSMLVDDGVIQSIFVEPEEPGDPFRVSDADTMLRQIAPDAAVPQAVSIFTKLGCPYCAQAKALLAKNGYRFEEIVLGRDGVGYTTLRAVTGKTTTPQVYIDGQQLAGVDALRQFLLRSVHKPPITQGSR